MDLLAYYKSLDTEGLENEILCLLLDKDLIQFNKGLKKFDSIISKHVGMGDLNRLLKETLPLLINDNAFILENGEMLNSHESIEIIESILYLEILFEDFIRKSGRRSFFLSTFKQASLDWIFLAFEFLISKVKGMGEKDILAYYLGLKKFDLSLIKTLDKSERIKIFIELSRKKQIGLFQDGSFIGFKNYKKINSVEEIQYLIFDEIDMLLNYITKQSGYYFDAYGIISSSQSIPKSPEAKKEVPKLEAKKETLLEKNLKLFNITKMPESEKELKKIFYRLAQATHPDKFEHIEKGTQTEIAIGDKFKVILAAYEYILKELHK